MVFFEEGTTTIDGDQMVVEIERRNNVILTQSEPEELTWGDHHRHADPHAANRDFDRVDVQAHEVTGAHAGGRASSASCRA